LHFCAFHCLLALHSSIHPLSISRLSKVDHCLFRFCPCVDIAVYCITQCTPVSGHHLLDCTEDERCQTSLALASAGSEQQKPNKAGWETEPESIGTTSLLPDD
jgi:hypothetical protein